MLLLLSLVLCQVDSPIAGLKALEGTWHLEAVVEEGKEHKPSQVRIVIQGEKFTTFVKDKADLGGTIGVTPGKQWLDFQKADGEVLLPTLYKLEGDTLTICVNADDEERPKEISAPKGSGRRVSIYKRKKD